jgi:alkanesulfonate monooxygenase SsuD/methylene tetrahydromethanopterin reductase-like flavin-dependent oxidoreductase (luciferase family)
VKPYYHYLRWKYPDMGSARGSAAPAGAPPLDAATEEQLRASIICGRPDEVAAQIAQFRDGIDPDIHFICRSDFPGMPQDLQLETIELLGTKVFPSLR